jgi:hypothetical protein
VNSIQANAWNVRTCRADDKHEDGVGRPDNIETAKLLTGTELSVVVMKVL